MSLKNFFIILLLIIFTAVLLLFFFVIKNASSKQKGAVLIENFKNISAKNINDGENILIGIAKTTSQLDSQSEKLEVEVVVSRESIQKGLGDRDEIGSDGMLFVFSEAAYRNFWMLDMRFDLDFVWIDGDRVVGISRNIQKPVAGTQNKDLDRIFVDYPTDKVLELNAGDVDKYQIEVGDVVIIK